MNNKNEDNMKMAIKNLIIETPEKTAFFDGLKTDAPIPPFVPSAETIERKGKDSVRRRRFNAGLIASAAACFAFVFLAIYRNAPEPPAVAAVDTGAPAPVMARAAGQIYEAACACPQPVYAVCITALAILFAVLFVIKRRNRP